MAGARAIPQDVYRFRETDLHVCAGQAGTVFRKGAVIGEHDCVPALHRGGAVCATPGDLYPPRPLPTCPWQKHRGSRVLCKSYPRPSDCPRHSSMCVLKKCDTCPYSRSREHDSGLCRELCFLLGLHAHASHLFSVCIECACCCLRAGHVFGSANLCTAG